MNEKQKYFEECSECDEKVEMDFPHEDIYCCDGHGGFCGCDGYPINPVVCAECEDD